MANYRIICGKCGADAVPVAGKRTGFRHVGDEWECPRCQPQPPPGQGQGEGQGGGGRSDSGRHRQPGDEAPPENDQGKQDESEPDDGKDDEKDDKKEPDDGTEPQPPEPEEKQDEFGPEWEPPELPKHDWFSADKGGERPDDGHGNDHTVYRSRPGDFSIGGGADEHGKFVQLDSKKRMFIEYHSVDQMVRDALTGKAENAAITKAINEFLHRAVEAKKNKGDYYYHGHDKESMLQAIIDPPQAGLLQVEDLRSQLEEAMADQGMARKRVRRVPEGDEVNIDQFLKRDPDMWDVSRRKHHPNLCLRIGINTAVNSGEGPDAPAWRGAAVATLVDILAAQGHSCEIWQLNTIANISHGLKQTFQRTLVKPMGASVDLAAIALAVGEVAFFRIVSLVACMRNAIGEPHYGWGQAVTMDSWPELKASYDITVDSNTVRGKESAIKFIQNTLQSAHAWSGADGTEFDRKVS
jgi:hypothetical protein